ncbi:TonB-dependent receptor [Novosphingobium sp.]|uniref:TonB-dependent receptor n=1 Tax=Novosphingobium sp. TaxID=1874826 RepID=UPI003B5290F9
MIKTSLRTALLVSACCLAGTAPVRAQTAAPAAGATPAPDVSEIIVTAQNRKESVQNVPIAINVVSSAALERAGVTDFTSVMKVAPELNITTDTNNTRVSLRGVGTNSNNEGQDQSIAVDIDGEYINRPTVLNAAIFDLDRAEVLKGPQGTLYGRNSTGGAINFITRQPGNVFAGNASITYGNYNQVIAEGGVDVPFGDIGAVRVSGIYHSHDGYTDHPNTPFSPSSAYTPSSARRSETDGTGGGRISLRLEPASNLHIRVAGEHVEDRFIPQDEAYADLTAPGNNPGGSTTSCGNGWASVGTDPSGMIECVPQHTNTLANVDRHSYNSPTLGVGHERLISSAVRGRVAWDVTSGVRLTYTGAYRYTDDTNVLTLAPTYLFPHFGETVKTQSHELRANGEVSGVKWQGGAFYFREQQTSDQGLWSPNLFFQGFYINYFKHPTDTKSISGFGQVEVPLTSSLTAVAGARYTHDKRDGLWNNYTSPVGLAAVGTGPVDLGNGNFVSPYCTGALANPFHAPPFLFCQSPGEEKLHFSGSKFTWTAGLNYKPDTRTLIYAKVSTGYKAGGFDGTGATFLPESNTAYEAGAKLNLGNRGQHTLNLSGFYYDYTNLQNDVLLNPSKGAQTFNAGKARLYGLEAEAHVRATPNDTISATASWLHANYVQFTASVNYYGESGAYAPTINLAGNRLPQAPNYLLTLAYDHTFHLGDAGTVTASAFERYKGSYYLDFYNFNDSRQGAHTETDLSLEYRTVNKRFSLQAYVRNLENYRSLVYAGNTVVAGQANIYNWGFGNPRTFGARAGFEF